MTVAVEGMLPSGLPECGAQRSELRDDGLWRPAEPRCPEPPAYEVLLTFDAHCQRYSMCPDHTAWARAHWSSVTGVRQVTA